MRIAKLLYSHSVKSWSQSSTLIRRNNINIISPDSCLLKRLDVNPRPQILSHTSNTQHVMDTSDNPLDPNHNMPVRINSHLVDSLNYPLCNLVGGIQYMYQARDLYKNDSVLSNTLRYMARSTNQAEIGAYILVMQQPSKNIAQCFRNLEFGFLCSNSHLRVD